MRGHQYEEEGEDGAGGGVVSPLRSLQQEELDGPADHSQLNSREGILRWGGWLHQGEEYRQAGLRQQTGERHRHRRLAHGGGPLPRPGRHPPLQMEKSSTGQTEQYGSLNSYHLLQSLTYVCTMYLHNLHLILLFPT